MNENERIVPEEDRFEEMLSAAQTPAPQPDRAFLQRLKEKSTQAFLAGASPQPADKRKFFMKKMKTIKWLTPTAVAACVVIGLAVWWAMSGPPITQTAYAELMQAIENSNAAEWVHFKTVLQGKDVEVWMSVRPLRQFVKTPEEMQFLDFSTGKRFTYAEATRTIEIVALPTDDFPKSILEAKSLLAIFLAAFDKVEAQVTREQITIDGEEFIQFIGKYTDPDGAEEVVTLLVDSSTNRIIRIKGEGDKKPEPYTWDLDYPETGPADIYELGVPRDAKVIDRTSESEQPQSEQASEQPQKLNPFDQSFAVAIKIVDAREDWPETPEALCKAYWQARATKRFDEMAILWPGSASFNESLFKDEMPVKYVFGKAEHSVEFPGVVIVPYASEAYYSRHNKYNLKMLLKNEKSTKGRYYIISGN